MATHRSPERKPQAVFPYGRSVVIILVMQCVYTLGDIRTLTGFSSRQLDHYARTGLLCPSVAEAAGYGSRRLYSPGDVLLLLAFRELKRAGIGGSVAREALSAIKGFSGRLESLAGRFLVFEAGHVEIAGHPDGVPQGAEGAGVAWRLDLGSLVRSVQAQGPTHGKVGTPRLRGSTRPATGPAVSRP